MGEGEVWRLMYCVGGRERCGGTYCIVYSNSMGSGGPRCSPIRCGIAENSTFSQPKILKNIED